jgi:hypothetical protein
MRTRSNDGSSSIAIAPADTPSSGSSSTAPAPSTDTSRAGPISAAGASKSTGPARDAATRARPPSNRRRATTRRVSASTVTTVVAPTAQQPDSASTIHTRSRRGHTTVAYAPRTDVRRRPSSGTRATPSSTPGGVAAPPSDRGAHGAPTTSATPQPSAITASA